MPNKLNLKNFNPFIFLFITNCAYFNTFYNAQNYYKQAIKLVPHDTLKVDFELFDKTIEKSTAVIVKYPNSRYVDDALFFMGSSYYYKGDYPRAIEKLNFLLENFPNSKYYDDALYYRGLADYKSDKLSRAIIAFNELLNSHQFKKRAGIMLCYSYYKDKNYSSLNNIGKIMLKERLNKKLRREILNILGDAQYDLKLYNEALATYEELLSLTNIAEEAKRLKLKVARIYLDQGEYEKCQKFLAGEDDPEFKLILADLYKKLNMTTEAKEVYLELAQSNQKDYAACAYYELGKIGEKEDSLKQAVAYYDSAAKMPSGEYSTRAKKRGDILKKMDGFLSDTTDVARAKFYLAELYYIEMNDTTKALKLYEDVYKEFPKSIWGPKALYACFYLAKNVMKNDSLALTFAEELIKKYEHTDYAQSAKEILKKNE